MAIEDNTYETAEDIIVTYGYDLSDVTNYLVRFLGCESDYVANRLEEALVREIDDMLYEGATS